MTHDQRLSEIEARLSALTRPPWTCLAVDETGRAQVVSMGAANGHAPLVGVFKNAADARFVAKAPEDVAWLLGRLRASLTDRPGTTGSEPPARATPG